ncbi:hypothetical protein A374_19155 [Fictibacillus macauensis ZFHKF-1]|uniref:Uncharacterized protein n=1 Tax=Fictibacillus macauensis ZFHKF-1 TaxID=1196324 RepID=I8AEC5_9BACL|nr:hypothetical protein [Fictibacillus macauensis]EIT83669.1 hypothetical protein A374_19155 [Fictibacillus macauensis ZFHKF-1]
MKEQKVIQFIKGKTDYNEATIERVLKEEARYLQNAKADVDMDDLIDYIVKQTKMTELEVDQILEKELLYYETR